MRNKYSLQNHPLFSYLLQKKTLQVMYQLVPSISVALFMNYGLISTAADMLFIFGHMGKFCHVPV